MTRKISLHLDMLNSQNKNNITYNGTRLGEVAEHKTSLELQMFKLR